MKKILFLSVLTVLAVSCHKVPSPTDRDGEYLVYTSRSDNTDFSVYKTYNIPDSLLVIGRSAKPEYSKSSDAMAIVSQYKAIMDSYGYTYTPDKDAADIGIQATYIIETENYINYISDPYWWLNYPGYWHPGYWGHWTGWNYGYPVVYSFSTNSLITEMVDLTAEKSSGSQLDVIWTSYIGGPGSGSIHADKARLNAAVKQSFAQSQYLDHGGK